MKIVWVALALGAGGYGLHAFATQLSPAPGHMAAGQRPMSAAQFAHLSRTDPQALRKFLHAQAGAR